MKGYSLSPYSIAAVIDCDDHADLHEAFRDSEQNCIRHLRFLSVADLMDIG
jgi:hypothetical protein